MTSSGLDGTADPRVEKSTKVTTSQQADAVPASPAKSKLRQAMTIAASLGLGIAVLVFVIPQFADLDKVWEQVQAMTGLEIAVLAVAAMWNLITYWIVIVLATPGDHHPQAAVVTESTTAVANTVPAGGAVAVGLNYAMLASWGFSEIAGDLVGHRHRFVEQLRQARHADPGPRLPGAPGRVGWWQDRRCRRGSGCPRRERRGVCPHLAQRGLCRSGCSRRRSLGVGPSRVFHRGPVTGWDIAVVKFRSRVIGLVRNRWVALTIFTIVGHLSLYAVLLIALRQVGVSEDEVGWAQVLAVFAFARLLTAIPVTPGGIGVIEVALIAGLKAAGNDAPGLGEQVVAAVLVFRVLTYVLPIPLGLITYVFWRRNKSWHDSAPPLDEQFAAV